MKDVLKHALWVGCILCVAPLLVRGYMWGKCTDALADGSQARFTLPSYHGLEYAAMLLGAAIIAIVIIKALCASWPEKKTNGKIEQQSET